MNRPDIQRQQLEMDLSELAKILRAMPGNVAERYMVNGKGPWGRWAVRFVNYYGQCPSELRDQVAEAFTTHFSQRVSHLPPDLDMVEILWDFGKESEHFSQLADLFHRLIQRYQQVLEPEKFQSVVVHRLQEGGIIPRSEWGQYDSHEQVPSEQTRIRLEHVESDAMRERRLMEKHQLPEDPDVMTHMLKKMKKIQMGLPRWPAFLAEVQAKYQTTTEWPEIQHELEKIQQKFPDWWATQIR